VTSTSSGTPSQDGILPLQMTGEAGDAWVQVTSPGNPGWAWTGTSPMSAASGAMARTAARRRIVPPG
jgi:hypothetical protein